MKLSYNFLFRGVTLLFGLIITLNTHSQTNQCNNNAGGQLSVATSCTPQAMNTSSNNDYWNGASGCNATDRDDRWAWFVATSTSTTITYNPDIEDPILTLLTGSCNPNMGSLACSDNIGNGVPETIVFATTIGTVYRIRIQVYNSNAFMSGTICVFGIPPVVSNDDPCLATPLTVGAVGVCTNITGTNVDATASAGVPAPGCGDYSGGDVWYSAIVPASGSITFTTSSASGITDTGIATYTGICGALTLENCNDDFGANTFSEITEIGLTPGTTIYVRVWDYQNDDFGDFNICAHEPIPPNICGESGTNLNTNDFCSTPATLTIGGASFSATTAATFTKDNPAAVETLFCGTIENNSWYRFEALATTHVFDISSVQGCTNGIQAEVYDIVYDVNGCCTGFTSVSNCYSPGTTGLGIVTATGLTIGRNYTLMIDGNGGANCDFTITGWSGANILPVSLIGLFGHTFEEKNQLTWTTASELNNDYFIIEKSFNGVDYHNIGTVQGNGNSTSKIDYSFSDFEINFSLAYYRLTQVDFNGTTEEIGTLKMTRELNNIVSYPNPSTNELNFIFNTLYSGDLHIEYIDINGKSITESVPTTTNNTFKSTIFHTLSSGIYFTKIRENGIVIQTMKTIKL